MKVAIAKEGNSVSQHFGHCPEYALYDIENKTVTKTELLKSPGHEPGKLPALLAEHKVTHVLAGGMGPAAVNLFCQNNIDVILGVTGPVDTVIQDFINGKISPGKSSCDHSHECS
ncbi:MAG: NifB/NifX family molybdenum-iron cluster-binding protein [Methanoregula sp.]